MRHVLVPVLTPQDIEALPNLVQFLASQKPLAIVVLHNPSLGITGEDATKDIDSRISSMETAKKEAAIREDYPAAEQMRQQIEGLKMERKDLLREGWKKATTEVREKAYSATILNEFVRNFSNTPTHVRQVILEEDTSYDGLFQTLAGMTKVWPNCLPMGDFSVVFPRTVPKQPTITVVDSSGSFSIPSSATVSVVAVADSRPSDASGGTLSRPAKQKAVAKTVKGKKQPSTPTSVPDTREGKAEYYRRFHLSLKKAAKDLGVPTEGRSKEEISQAVLDRQFPIPA